MRFAAYHQLGDRPNLVVDGAPNQATVLTLSHWPSAGTPTALADDLSAQIVFRYLDAPQALEQLALAYPDRINPHI